MLILGDVGRDGRTVIGHPFCHVGKFRDKSIVVGVMGCHHIVAGVDGFLAVADGLAVNTVQVGIVFVLAVAPQIGDTIRNKDKMLVGGVDIGQGVQLLFGFTQAEIDVCAAFIAFDGQVGFDGFVGALVQYHPVLDLVYGAFKAHDGNIDFITGPDLSHQFFQHGGSLGAHIVAGGLVQNKQDIGAQLILCAADREGDIGLVIYKVSGVLVDGDAVIPVRSIRQKFIRDSDFLGLVGHDRAGGTIAAGKVQRAGGLGDGVFGARQHILNGDALAGFQGNGHVAVHQRGGLQFTAVNAVFVAAVQNAIAISTVKMNGEIESRVIFHMVSNLFGDFKVAGVDIVLDNEGILYQRKGFLHGGIDFNDLAGSAIFVQCFCNLLGSFLISCANLSGIAVPCCDFSVVFRCIEGGAIIGDAIPVGVNDKAVIIQGVGRLDGFHAALENSAVIAHIDAANDCIGESVAGNVNFCRAEIGLIQNRNDSKTIFDTGNRIVLNYHRSGRFNSCAAEIAVDCVGAARNGVSDYFAIFCYVIVACKINCLLIVADDTVLHSKAAAFWHKSISDIRTFKGAVVKNDLSRFFVG